MPVISLDKQRADAFRSINDWAETLRFRSDGVGGGAGYDVQALVTRGDVQAMQEAPSVGGPVFKIMVVHEAQRYSEAEDVREYSGLNIQDIRDGRSVLDIARRPGETPKSRTIRVLDDSDEAVLYLECR